MLRPEDIADMSDRQLAVIAAGALEQAGRGETGSGFWAAVAREVGVALADRKRAWLVLETEMMNAGALEGSIVGADDDPLGEARAELRERPWWLVPDTDAGDDV